MSSNFLIDKNGRQSKGVLLLRTLAMPSNTNANGDIFGGWIMSQMDMGGAILAKEIAHGRVVTVAVESVTDAVFTFVAVDSNGKSRTIPRENNHELEKALALIAELESEQTNQ